jgi:hypothetical protein
MLVLGISSPDLQRKDATSQELLSKCFGSSSTTCDSRQ